MCSSQRMIPLLDMGVLNQIAHCWFLTVEQNITASLVFQITLKTRNLVTIPWHILRKIAPLFLRQFSWIISPKESRGENFEKMTFSFLLCLKFIVQALFGLLLQYFLVSNFRD